MALIVVFTNDATGTETSANYDVCISVGDGTLAGSRIIERGRLEGHDRGDGWARLVLAYLLRRKRAAQAVHDILDAPPRPKRRRVRPVPPPETWKDRPSS